VPVLEYPVNSNVEIHGLCVIEDFVSDGEEKYLLDFIHKELRKTSEIQNLRTFCSSLVDHSG
jgi:hypothetical protein